MFMNWIKVGDQQHQMPDKDGVFDVFTNNGERITDVVFKWEGEFALKTPEWYIDWNDYDESLANDPDRECLFPISREVTHWMPLPEPPK